MQIRVVDDRLHECFTESFAATIGGDNHIEDVRVVRVVRQNPRSGDEISIFFDTDGDFRLAECVLYVVEFTISLPLVVLVGAVNFRASSGVSSRTRVIVRHVSFRR